MSDSTPLNEQAAFGAKRVFRLNFHGLLLALNGFRTSLKNVDLAVGAVLAPFDIHRATVVLLDDAGKFGEFDHVFVGNGETAAIFRIHIHGTNRAADGGIRFKLHADQFGTKRLADDRELAGIKRGLKDIELIGIDSALHDGFAEAVGCGDEDHLVEARFGIEREHHAGSALVGTAHALHAGRKRHFSVRKAFMNTVGNGAVVIERREDFLHMMQDGINTDHIKNRFLLAGKGSVRKVFSCGRGSYGY